MSVSKLIHRLHSIDYHIRSKSTGNSTVFAKKLNISRSWLFILLDELRSIDAPIYWDKARNSYCYSDEGYLFVGFIKHTDSKVIPENLNPLQNYL